MTSEAAPSAILAFLVAQQNYFGGEWVFGGTRHVWPRRHSQEPRFGLEFRERQTRHAQRMPQRGASDSEAPFRWSWSCWLAAMLLRPFV